MSLLNKTLLAIDPSINKLGVAVFKGRKMVFCSTLTTKLEGDNRYVEITLKIKELINKVKPDVFAIETQYMSFQSNAAFKIAEVKGICRALFLSFNSSGQMIDVGPSEVKKVMGMPGRTKRKEAKILSVQFAKDNFGITVDDNQSDAIGIGMVALAKIRL